MLNNRILKYPFLCEMLPLLMAVAATPAMHFALDHRQAHTNEYITFCLFRRDFWGHNYLLLILKTGKQLQKREAHKYNSMQSVFDAVFI